DLLLKPADPDASMRGVRDAVKSGRLTERRLELSARKVLAAKYDLGLVQQRLTPLDEIDRVVAGKQAVALPEEIAEPADPPVRIGQARSVALPEPGMKALNELLKRKAPLIGISFGNPYLLLSVPKLQTYLVAYGDMPSLQEAAAEALVGKIDITGRLPISLPGLYPRGTGIQFKAASEK